MKARNKSHNGSILIKNGFIVDGSGKKGFWGDILIQGERIRSVKRRGELGQTSSYVLDLKRKKVVSPGFIDMHGHSDLAAFYNPLMESKLAQGITAEVIGNCGLTPAPCSSYNAAHLEDVYHCRKFLKGWRTFHSYLRDMKKRKASLKLIPLVGQGTLHSYYCGYKERKMTGKLREKIRKKAQESLNEGAWGLSLGLIYPPGCFTDKLEMKALFRAVKQENAFVAVHMRDEGDNLISSVEELINLSKKCSARLHIAHLKVHGKKNWSKRSQVLRMIREARKEGLNITADRYPYRASWTDLDAILPELVYKKGHLEEIRMLANKESREKVKKIFFENPAHRSRDYFESILISQIRGAKNKIYEGKNLKQVASMMRREPFDAMCELLVGARLMVTAVFFGMSEKNMENIICEPYTVIGTDSSARSFSKLVGKPHPRAFGTFPRFFELFVKSGKMSLEKGVRKCTGLTSDIIGLKDTGYIKEGYFADITVFDLGRIKDRSSYSHPAVKPDGIEYVLVNGGFHLFQGEITGERKGHVVCKE